MLNPFKAYKNLKDKYQNSSTWTDFFFSLAGLEEQLANAKSEKEKNKILTQIVEAQKKQLELLGEENEELKKQLKNQEEEIKKLKNMIEGVIEMKVDTSGIGKRIERINALIEITKNE